MFILPSMVLAIPEVTATINTIMAPTTVAFSMAPPPTAHSSISKESVRDGPVPNKTTVLMSLAAELKTSNATTTIMGRISGKIIRRYVCTHEAPQVFEASSNSSPS